MVPLALGHKALCSLAEQVWAPSTHAAEVVRLVSRTPVSVVPWPVVPSGSPPEPSACCVFVAVVGEGEPVARANPLAALDAFRQAFARSERGVLASLAVVLAGSKGRDEARVLLETQTADVGASLVVDPSREELRALVSSADVYVSLHRSQASGLCLADALAGGRPAVATGYSGNLDYMDDDSSALVGYTVRPVVLGDLYLDPGRDGPTRRGQFWADADVDGAARSMRRLALDPDLRRLMGHRAREVVLARLGPEATADAARRP
jgi:glycosyltransferase involved in cell wall biosynthesis